MAHRLVAAAALVLCVTCGATAPAPGAPPPAATGARATPPASYADIGRIALPQAPRAFDHAVIDDVARLLYLADRSNGAVDVIDLRTETFAARIGGFHSGGPNGLELVPDRGELWAADGDSSVRVIDTAKRVIVATIATGGQGRADDLAYDAHDQVVIVGNDSEATPFLTFISTGARRIVGRIDVPGALGLEEVHWSAERDVFYQAVPSTNASRDGEIEVIDPIARKVMSVLALQDCGPHGLAIGPHDELLLGCGSARTLIVDGRSGSPVASYAQIGGADVVWFDATAARYFVAGSGTGVGGSARGTAIGIIDATAHRWMQNVPVPSGSHSVVADPTTHRVYVPVSGEGIAVLAGAL